MNIIKKWTGKGIEDDGGVVSEQFKQFSRDFRSAIKTAAMHMGAELVSYTSGHYDMSGFLSKDGRYVYFHYSVPRGELPLNLYESSFMGGVLIRTASGPKDYTGGQNRYCSVYGFEEAVRNIFARA